MQLVDLTCDYAPELFDRRGEPVRLRCMALRNGGYHVHLFEIVSAAEVFWSLTPQGEKELRDR